MRYFYTLLTVLILTGATTLHAQDAPAELYLVGSPNNWTTPDIASPEQLIVIPAKSEGIYEVSFYYDSSNYAQNSLSFKIFTEKADWSNQEAYWGCTLPEAPESRASEETYSWDMAQGWDGGDFTVGDWTAGTATVTVDWNAKKLTLTTDAVVQAPESYYLVGDFTEWNIYDHRCTLVKNGNRYSGSFNIPAGQFEFKILREESWEFNLGYGSFDLWSNSTRSIKLIQNGDNIKCNNWQGGSVDFVFDHSTRILEITAPQQPVHNCIYLVGSPQGWNIEKSDMDLTEIRKGVYENSFEIEACDDLYFRFYSQLGNWDLYSIGSNIDDIPTTISLTDGYYSGDAVWGKGSWHIPYWPGGKLHTIVDTNTMTVQFDDLSSGVESTIAESGITYKGNIATSAEGRSISVADICGRTVVRSADSTVDLSELPAGVYIVSDGCNTVKIAR